MSLPASSLSPPPPPLRVRLNNKDPEAIRGFIDEITLLKQLRNTPNIIQLVNAQVRPG